MRNPLFAKLAALVMTTVATIMPEPGTQPACLNYRW
jgi:hypothetical protein